MAHPELWYFLAPAEEGEEMNFGKLEEVCLPLSHTNCAYQLLVQRRRVRA